MGPQYAIFMVTVFFIVGISATSDTSTIDSETPDCKLSDKCGAEALAVLMITLVVCLCVYCFCCFQRTPKPYDMDTFIPDSSYWWRKLETHRFISRKTIIMEDTQSMYTYRSCHTIWITRVVLELYTGPALIHMAWRDLYSFHGS